MCRKHLRLTRASTHHFFDLAAYLTHKGHDVVYFSMQDPGNLQTPYAKYFVNNIDFNISVSSLQYLKEGLHALYSLEAKAKIERLVLEVHPDVVFLQEIYHHLSPSILITLKKFSLPTVLLLSDYFLICPSYRLLAGREICELCRGHRYYNAVLRRCFHGSLARSLASSVITSIHRMWRIYENNVDFFVVPTEFARNKHIEFGIPAHKIVVIPHAISLDNFVPSYDSEGYIVYFGILEKWKGIATLIRAMKSLPHVPLLIVGDGRHRPLFERLAEEIGAKNVTFVGYLVGEKLWDVVRGAQFVVVPSEWYEVYGMVIYEAFALGKPVIASRIGGIPELVRDGKDGLLFDMGHVDDLTGKIRMLFGNHSLCLEMGRAGRKKVETELTAEKQYRALISLYHLVRNSNIYDE